jgi:hypothetical protein
MSIYIALHLVAGHDTVAVDVPIVEARAEVEVAGGRHSHAVDRGCRYDMARVRT